MLSRRGFLIGAGSLLTAAFVKDARAFVARTNRPLLATAARGRQTLYWYDNGDGLLLTIGRCELEPPPPPTWREFFVSEGIAHTTEDEALPDGPTTGSGRSTTTSRWTAATGRPVSIWKAAPAPRPIACSKTWISARLARDATGRTWYFRRAAYPGDDSRWVEANDEFALSLLQARLIDLKLPISIVEGT